LHLTNKIKNRSFLPRTDIATAHGLSSAATPKRKIEKALGKMREAAAHY